MGYLLKTIKTNDLKVVADNIKFLSISPLVQQEMGEPFKYKKDQTWYFAFEGNELIGLLCHNLDTILYAYTTILHRNKGVFYRLYSEIPERKWKTLANKNSLPIFKQLGFEVTKSFNLYFKMIKK